MSYLGVDLGTSSIKVSLADQDGNILDSHSETYPLLMPEENFTEQNPEDWFEALKTCLKKLSISHDLRDVRAMSFCGQMHGLVILDEHDSVIRPCILWNDSRTTEEVDHLNEVIGKRKLLEETSNIALCGFTLPKLLWVRRHEPDNFYRISKIMLPKDYLVYRITGRFVSDITDLSGTLFFDVKDARYSPYLLNLAGISEDMLPEIHRSTDVIGDVSEDFARACGLDPSCKVIIGGGDQAVGAIGSGAFGDGSLSISLGTSGTVFASSDSYRFDEEGRVHCFRHADGNFHLMGCTLSAASSLRWWLEDILNTDDYDGELERMPDGISDIIFLPYLMGERSPINDPDARGMFSSLNMIHKRGELTKAVVEGICFSLFDNFQVMNELGLTFTEGKVIGGSSRSRSVMQILSDVFGIRLSNINTSDGGSLGAIILAMVGDGRFPDIREATDSIIKVTRTILPDMERHQRYLKKFKEYKNLYLRNRKA